MTQVHCRKSLGAKGSTLPKTSRPPKAHGKNAGWKRIILSFLGVWLADFFSGGKLAFAVLGNVISSEFHSLPQILCAKKGRIFYSFSHNHGGKWFSGKWGIFFESSNDSIGDTVHPFFPRKNRNKPHGFWEKNFVAHNCFNNFGMRQLHGWMDMPSGFGARW